MLIDSCKKMIVIVNPIIKNIHWNKRQIEITLRLRSVQVYPFEFVWDMEVEGVINKEKDLVHEFALITRMKGFCDHEMKFDDVN